MVAKLPRRIHCVGVAGGGLSALSVLLVEQGHVVSGSDCSESVKDAGRCWGGVDVRWGHDPAHVAGAELVIRSAAVPENNPEVVAARADGIPVLKYSEAVGRLMMTRRSVAVAGTHGKTTTTALLAHLLREAGTDPGWIVGGQPLSLPGAAAWGGAGPLVVEACEYDHSFLNLHYSVAVVTSVAPDHLDSLRDEAGVHAAFARFAGALPAGGTLVLGPGVAAGFSLPELRGVRVVPVEQALRLENVTEVADGFTGSVEGCEGHFRLHLLGAHNLDNLRVALAAGQAAGARLADLVPHVQSFAGVARRLQDLGPMVWPGGPRVHVVDDFAHHPDELAAACDALRSRFPGRRVVAVFQPHQVSRTEAFMDGFVRELACFDAVALCDIFVVRDAHPERADAVGRQLARKIGPVARRVGAASCAHGAVAAMLRPDDVCVVMGAGDIDGLAADLARATARSRAG